MYGKNGKKILFLLVAALFVLWLGACTNQPETSQAPTPAPAPAPAPQAQQPAQEKVEVKRGCLSCHVKAGDKDYSLAAEAVKVTGGSHPGAAPSGAKLDEKATVQNCLECHGVGTGASGAAKAAPITLRAIVHPAHMSSKTFTDRYTGNCFTCHEVDSKGTFNLLGEKVNINEKGIPKTFPIPNMIPPSQGGK